MVTKARRLTAISRVLLFGTLAVAVGFLATPGPAGAVTIETAVVDAVDRDGRYLEGSDPAIDDAIDEANRIGVAFIWFADSAGLGNAELLADEYVAELEAIGSEYHTVLVLTDDAYAAFSTVHSDQAMDEALEASFQSFSSRSASRGVSTFTDSLRGVTSTDSGAGTTATTTAQTADDSSSGGGIGFGTILLILAVLGGGFWLFRSWSKRRKHLEQAAIDLEEDRIEIEEQLKNNADRVILLGDRVIASGNRELIDLYEEASRTYQDVSQSIDGAETAQAVDALDDSIDEAEWQFEVIEARLDGRPDPPPPGPEDDAPGPAGSAPPPPPVPADQRAPSGDDRSVITSPTTGRDYRRPSGSTRSTGGRTPSRRRGGGLGGGGLGGILGGVLGNIILGGGLGGSSRRTQRRSGGINIPGMGGRSTSPRTTGGGGLGGGVLRRGGGSPPTRSRSNTRSRTRPTRRRSTTRGGGRSLGNRRGGGRRT